MRAGAITHFIACRPAPVAGRFALTPAAELTATRPAWPVLLLALALAGPLGCGGLKAPGGAAAPDGFRPIAKPQPAATPAIATFAPVATTRPTTATTTTQPAPGASDIERPGNPAAWGESAQLSVGRQFEPVYFDADSYELDVSARQRLRDYARWLQEHPKVWITLAGHADPFGSTRYAYNLAMARALATQDYLIGQGLSTSRFFAIGFGADLPAAEGAPEQTRTLNNRVELLAFIAPLGYEEPAPIPAEKQPAPGEQEPVPAGSAKELVN